MNKSVNVIKRNGNKEQLDLSKINSSLEWAAEGLNVSVSDVLINADLHFFDGIKTEDIHDILIKVTDDMSSIKNIDYDKMSMRLVVQKIYRIVFESNTPTSLRNMLMINSSRGYKQSLSTRYTTHEIIELGQYINYDRNFDFTKAGIDNLLTKYNMYHNDVLIEDPQTMYMAIAMDIFMDYKKDSRIEMVKHFYDLLSLQKISLPTPMMKALRTMSFDYASCITMKAGDNKESWTAVMEAVMLHTMSSAGIGVDTSSIASIGDWIKNKLIKHNGKIPFLKMIDSIIGTSSQEGRRGQAVAYTNFYDPEIFTILSLKSPRTEANKRINDLKHAIKLNQLFYDRIVSGGMISLFSPRQQVRLDKLFNSNKYTKFKKLYEKLERQEKYSSQIPARELAEILFAVERPETGVYYIMNVDEANMNKSYTDDISQSNICMEFISPTKDLMPNTTSPSIGVCILTNINQGLVPEDDLPHVTKMIVYALNQIMHRQKHPTRAANEFVRQYASLGIGISNHAYWIAKHGFRYGDQEALNKTNEYAEAFQFNLLSASSAYAAEFNAEAPKFRNGSTYAEGILPQDRCNQYAVSLVKKHTSGKYDWNKLKSEINKHGLANVALSMIPPSETSSITGNQTSSIEMIKNALTIKDSKTGQVKQYAPEANKLAHLYDYAYESRDATNRFIKHAAIWQMWIDMGISTNTLYNPELNEINKIYLKDIMKDIFLAKKLGLKTLYYNNVKVPGDEQEQETCGSGGCSV